ncbi:MAG: ABC transporter ATP-binding protein [Kiritimatiellae bacterium]|jgi:ABC-2 type transport system ATP-binding protein|nr:ABC transporter ATP-binding protein [Kiritimatiellia bacterium]MDD4341330.1 ABC transporter ATP-binding protein [Kiritimatiellia bacterium]MDY0149337.1 ABC transporter ATP-binding protein [Kiritimatiellia bacterium]
MSAIIQIDNMTKRYRKTVAVDRLSLTVPAGSIFAFLGPNGAGKTTTIKTVMNILQPEEGGATVLGVPSTELGPAEFQQIGYVSENQQMPGWLTVKELTEFCAPMYPTWDWDFCNRLHQQFDLPLNRKIRHLSRGMRVKAALLTSLAYRPRLLMLDEPFTGLDPLVRDEFIRGVLELTEQENWTVFISSHDIDEVERLADWVGFLNKGHLDICESVAVLQERFRRVEVVQEKVSASSSAWPSPWLVREQAGKTLTFVDSAYDAGTEERVRQALDGCRDVRISPLTLREIFLTLARTYRITE